MKYLKLSLLCLILGYGCTSNEKTNKVGSDEMNKLTKASNKKSEAINIFRLCWSYDQQIFSRIMNLFFVVGDNTNNGTEKLPNYFFIKCLPLSNLASQPSDIYVEIVRVSNEWKINNMGFIVRTE